MRYRFKCFVQDGTICIPTVNIGDMIQKQLGGINLTARQIRETYLLEELIIVRKLIEKLNERLPKNNK